MLDITSGRRQGWHIHCPKCGDLHFARGISFQIYRCLGNEPEGYKAAITEEDRKLGEFIDTPPPVLGDKGDERRVKASAYIRQHGPDITIEALHQIANQQKPKVKKRVELLMRELINDSHDIGQLVPVNSDNPKWLSVTWSSDWEQVIQIVNYCNEVGWYAGKLDHKCIGGLGTVTVEGWNQFEFTKNTSQQIFIAMSFDDSMGLCGDNIEAAISSAGFIPKRVDKIEHVDKIDDRIIYEIENSIAIVADFTGHRGGVYFEAGYALGIGIPVIWTCRKDDINNLHFDIRQYNCIVWEKEEDLKSKLKTRIQSMRLDE